ncbi:choice-of-anchor Q domain-containing protein [Microbacterium sp. DT81.1]|uniref:choice-of-anchor Q domain-containing protein n=1 Tax=Microbacterium sp. DT81.1 TaxID=3393413 RepID=UPI003CF54623
MKFTRSISVIALAAVFSGAGVAAHADAASDGPTTYFVSGAGADTNTGLAPDQAFRSIQRASDLTEPGDTVEIMDGEYADTSGQGVLRITRSGTLDAPITYRAYHNQTPVIRPVTGWNGVSLVGASHIVLDGLEIRGNADNLTLEDATANASPGKATYNQNCVHARKNAAGERWSHLTVINSHIYDCPGGGLSTTGGDYITFADNVVHSNAWYSVYANSGISILTPEDVDDATGYKIRIENNVSYDNESKVKWIACNCISDGNGIIVDSTLNARSSGGVDYKGRTLVANNVVFDNGGTGIHAYRSANVDILNNTGYLNSRSPFINNPNISAFVSRDVRVINNVSVTLPGKPSNSAYRNENVLYDYNTYWGGAEPEVLGANDLIVDPEFVAPSTDPAVADFRLTRGSPAGDTGIALPEVTDDFDGKKRPSGSAFDRGAFELRGRH